MKKILIFISVCLFTVSSFAQSDNDYLELAREVLKAEKKAVIAEAMQLTDMERQPFWDLYNEYQGELYKVQNKRIAIITDYSEHYESMTNEKADELWMASMKYVKEVSKLEGQYYKKFKKILPAGKAARFFHAENKIETLIDAQLALEIPLIEIK